MTFVTETPYHAQKIGLVILPEGLLRHIEQAENHPDHKDDDKDLTRGDCTGCLIQGREYLVVIKA
jgi:hypothetical protein